MGSSVEKLPHTAASLSPSIERATASFPAMSYRPAVVCRILIASSWAHSFEYNQLIPHYILLCCFYLNMPHAIAASSLLATFFSWRFTVHVACAGVHAALWSVVDKRLGLQHALLARLLCEMEGPAILCGARGVQKCSQPIHAGKFSFFSPAAVSEYWVMRSHITWCCTQPYILYLVLQRMVLERSTESWCKEVAKAAQPQAAQK